MLLLGEGISSVAAEQAAKALMALAASELNKACPLLHPRGNACSTLTDLQRSSPILLRALLASLQALHHSSKPLLGPALSEAAAALGVESGQAGADMPATATCSCLIDALKWRLQDAIREAQGIEALLAILTQSVQQHREMQRPSGSVSATEGAAARNVLAQLGLGSRQGDRPNRGGLYAPVAAHAAGAIMNLQLNAKNKVALEQVGSNYSALLS